MFPSNDNSIMAAAGGRRRIRVFDCVVPISPIYASTLPDAVAVSESSLLSFRPTYWSLLSFSIPPSTLGWTLIIRELHRRMNSPWERLIIGTYEYRTPYGMEPHTMNYRHMCTSHHILPCRSGVYIYVICTGA